MAAVTRQTIQGDRAEGSLPFADYTQLCYVVHIRSWLSEELMSSTTLTVRLSEETKEKLGRLAEETKRTKSFLAGEAITGFVERELAIIEGIHRGLEDVRAGRVVLHDEVMAEADQIIEAAKKKRDGM